MIRSYKSLVIGLGIPAAAVLIGVPLLANTSVYVFGIPLLFFWMFAWFVLSTVCLRIAWHFDEPYYRDAPTVDRDGTH